MAYTELYYFNKKGTPKERGIAPQASTGGWKVWFLLKEKYLPDVPYLFRHDEYQKVWDLILDERLEKYEKIILASSFDWAIVYKENFDELIDAFEKFDSEHSGKLNFPEQIKILKEIKNNKNAIAIGWNQTSVNCDTWRQIGNRSSHSVLYNIFKENKHFNVFKEYNL